MYESPNQLNLPLLPSRSSTEQGIQSPSTVWNLAPWKQSWRKKEENKNHQTSEFNLSIELQNIQKKKESPNKQKGSKNRKGQTAAVDKFNIFGLFIYRFSDSANNHLDLNTLIQCKKNAIKNINPDLVELPGIVLSKEDFDNYFHINLSIIQTFFSDDHFQRRIQLLQDHGGVLGIQNYLRSNLRKGLDTNNIQDLLKRKIYFGSNTQKPLSIQSIHQNFLELLKKDHTFHIVFSLIFINTILSLVYKQKRFWDYFLTILSFLMTIYYRAYVKYKYFQMIIEHQNRLQTKNENDLNVIRDSHEIFINPKELLVGDILIFQQDDFILVDGILSKQFNKIKLIHKNKEKIVSLDNVNEDDPFIFAGSQIVEGEGQMIVLAVGQQTSYYMQFQSEFNKKLVLQDPFQQIVRKTILKEGKKSIQFLLFLFVILFYQLNPEKNLNYLRQIIDIVLYLVILFIVVIPANIVQILSMYMINVINIMRSKHIIAENYISLYWFGQINELIVDKTGCLTKSEMEISLIYDGSIYTDISKFKSAPNLFENICINSRGRFQDQQQRQCSRTELALLKFAYSHHFDQKRIRKNDQIKKVLTFQNIMVTYYQTNERQIRIYYKGNPEYLFPICNQPPPSAILKQFANLQQIVFAYKDITINSEIDLKEQIKLHNDQPPTNVNFTALIGISNPVRPEAIQVVNKLIQSKINVRLFTTDNFQMAVRTAKACGIIENSSEVTDRADFQKLFKGQFNFQSLRNLNPTFDFPGSNYTSVNQLSTFYGVTNLQKLQNHLQRSKVIANCQPKDKELLLYSLKLFDNIVCLTGDDAEHATAIEITHVGIALGGSEAKSSRRVADVVILDDSIQGIQECIAQGRGVFFAINSLIQGYRTSSSAIFLLSFFSALLDPNPFIMAMPTMMILQILLSLISKISLVHQNEKMKEKVMKQGPQNGVFKEIQKRQIVISVFLMFLEFSIIILCDHLRSLQTMISGIVILTHIAGISIIMQRYSLKLFGAFSALIIITLQVLIEHELDKIKWKQLFINYIITLLVIEINFSVVRRTKIID